jgi:cystathionine beta-lyase/cystathionine gamma-synthase
MISPLPHAFKLQMVHNRKGQQERDTESHISEVAYVALKYQADTIEFKTIQKYAGTRCPRRKYGRYANPNRL